MSFFTLFTPISYWLLIVLWSFIFAFYIHRIYKKRLRSKLLLTLLIVLAIDAFRTLFESIYFGAWYTSLVGFIPKSIHDLLVRPEFVFIPKFLNVIAALLIIFILLRRWIPEEEVEIESTLNEIKTLRGILPLCSFCKKIRDDKGYWELVDVYIHKHSEADISHSICPDCLEKNYPETPNKQNED